MTDPIKWFISILLGCAQRRNGRAEGKQRERERCEGEDVEETGGKGWLRRREEEESKINSVWFWWFGATADCRNSVCNFWLCVLVGRGVDSSGRAESVIFPLNLAHWQ